ncbi:S-formylglutathione hydrolase-like [Tropilaelaps mercedesae]|uniref:S-formylglutathione hydrolase n=1 Tax=Tropilaelaps mercedesae TaxID=418985 RepID=A0A1V9XDF4_9ACAR|nr:S-formylglutathione hydrolase-like [Tropilaelaps mercedesae]
MYSYITKELPEVMSNHFSTIIDASRCSIMGHSMGGHGALICALRNPDRFRSVSAFAPICAPSQCPWGEQAFNAYLGPDKDAWKAYDATELARTYSGPDLNILIDQGSDDKFLSSKQLLPQTLLEAAASNSKLKINYREHEGYDHSYFFVSTFIEDHIRLHSEALSH